MADIEFDGSASEVDADKDRYLSTSYSSKITCGACGASLKRVPVMYEHMDIDWRCGKCLRRDKPMHEERTA